MPTLCRMKKRKCDDMARYMRLRETFMREKTRGYSDRLNAAESTKEKKRLKAKRNEPRSRSETTPPLSLFVSLIRGDEHHHHIYHHTLTVRRTPTTGFCAYPINSLKLVPRFSHSRISASSVHILLSSAFAGSLSAGNTAAS